MSECEFDMCSDLLDSQTLDSILHEIWSDVSSSETVASMPLVPETVPTEQAQDGPLRRMPSSGQKSKGWAWTLNNPIMSGEALLAMLQRDVRVKYCVFQLEQGEQGTRHFQGYCFMKDPVRMSVVLSLFGDSWPHLEKAKGTPEQNRVYCTKEGRLGGPWSFGECPMNGKRSDLKRLAEKVMTGVTLKEIARAEPFEFAKYANGLRALSRYAEPPEMFREVEVRLYVGATGAGKTYAALAQCGYPQQDIYVKGTDQWFDNYVGQPCVVLDDFAGSASKMPLAETLRLLDRYRYQVQVKGGFEWFKPRLVIVTSNLHPRLWYDWSKREAQYKALQRRFHRVTLFREPCSEDMQGNCVVNQFGYVEEAMGMDFWIAYERYL